MNIAIYQPRVSYYLGGGEVLPLDHAVFLNRLGHRITIITTRAPFIREGEYFKKFKKLNKNIKIDYLNLPSSFRKIYKIPAGASWKRWNAESIAVARLGKNYFLSHKFDLITSYNVLDMRAVPSGHKSVLHLLGYPAKISKAYKSALAVPDLILAVSRYVKSRWLQMANLKNVYVSENGIESDYFRPDRKPEKYDILFVGRLIRIKGVAYLIKAADILKRAGFDLRIAIIGNGPMKEGLEVLSKKLNLAKSISFLGRVKSDKLVEIYNSVKVSVLPSYDREGILITMLESSSCGTPVITTTACSMKEFISNGKNGILVRPKSAADIAKAIKFICGNENLRKKMSKNARREVVKNWDWSIKIKKVAKLYEKISSAG